MKIRFIVKLGGAAVTDKSCFETLNESALEKSVQQLKVLYTSGVKFIVVHGAGSFGHFQASQSGVHKGGIENKSVQGGFSKTRLSVKKLNQLVTSAMVDAEIPAVGISPCGFWATSNREISVGEVDGIRTLLESGLIPVLHGDAVLDDALGCTILSGDVIVKYLAFHFKPDFVLFLTNVVALFDRPPTESGSQQIRRIVVQKDGGWKAEGLDASISFSMDSHDSTGGIQRKIQECVEVASQGVEVLLALIGSESSLEAMLKGPDVIASELWTGTIMSMNSSLE